MNDIVALETCAVSELLGTITTHEWRWNQAEWPDICRSLGLTETAHVDRAGYSRHEYAREGVAFHASIYAVRVFSVDVDVWASHASGDRSAWLDAYAEMRRPAMGSQA